MQKDPRGGGQFLPQRNYFINLFREALGHASYQMQKLWAAQFKKKGFLNLFSVVSLSCHSNKSLDLIQFF